MISKQNNLQFIFFVKNVYVMYILNLNFYKIFMLNSSDQTVFKFVFTIFTVIYLYYF